MFVTSYDQFTYRFIQKHTCDGTGPPRRLRSSPSPSAVTTVASPTGSWQVARGGAGCASAKMQPEQHWRSWCPPLHPAPAPGSLLAPTWVLASLVGPGDQAHHQLLWKAWPHPRNNTTPAAPLLAIREGRAAAGPCYHLAWPWLVLTGRLSQSLSRETGWAPLSTLGEAPTPHTWCDQCRVLFYSLDKETEEDSWE